jgi:hypothetical protein
MQLDTELIDVAGDLSPLRFVFFELAPQFADPVRAGLAYQAGFQISRASRSERPAFIVGFRRSGRGPTATNSWNARDYCRLAATLARQRHSRGSCIHHQRGCAMAASKGDVSCGRNRSGRVGVLHELGEKQMTYPAPPSTGSFTAQIPNSNSQERKIASNRNALSQV